MSTGAVVMMIVAIAILWGGLAVSIWNITRFRGEEPDTVGRDL